MRFLFAYYPPNPQELEMSERNNRSAYKQPTAAQVKEFRADPQYIQWRDVVKMVFVLTGESIYAWQAIEKLNPERIEKTEYWGWWRLTDLAYREFTKSEEDVSKAERAAYGRPENA